MIINDSEVAGWRTSVSQISETFSTLYGYPVDDLARSLSFTEGIFLAVSGSLPSDAQRKMMDCMLLLSSAHGVAPSGAVARSVAVCGSSMQTALAAGVMTFGEVHGGAGEALSERLQLFGLPVAHRDGVDAAAMAILEHFLDRGERIPGFGHAYHTNGDPRATLLLGMAQDLGIAATGCAVMAALEERLSSHLGRRLPMNVDGALSGVVLDMGIDWRFSRALMILARLPVLAAQVVEELENPSPGWRDLVLVGEKYLGEPRRPVPLSSLTADRRGAPETLL